MGIAPLLLQLLQTLSSEHIRYIHAAAKAPTLSAIQNLPPGSYTVSERPVHLHVGCYTTQFADPARYTKVDGHGALARFHLPSQFQHTAASLHAGARRLTAYTVNRPRVTVELILPRKPAVNLVLRIQRMGQTSTDTQPVTVHRTEIYPF